MFQINSVKHILHQQTRPAIWPVCFLAFVNVVFINRSIMSLLSYIQISNITFLPCRKCIMICVLYKIIIFETQGRFVFFSRGQVMIGWISQGNFFARCDIVLIKLKRIRQRAE